MMQKKFFVHIFTWILLLINSYICFGQAIPKPIAATPSKSDPCSSTVFLKTVDDVPLDPIYTTKDERIFWVSPTAMPGDKVLVKGAFTGAPKQIELTLVKQSFMNATIVNATPMGSTGITFEIPKSMPKGMYSFRIAHNTKLVGVVNEPTIYWTEGIGNKITPDAVQSGDSLLIVGTNFPYKGYVILKGKNGASLSYSYTADISGKRIMIKIPETVSLQEYSLQLSTGKTATTASSNSYAINIVQNTALPIRKIICSRLVGDGITDNTTILQDYLKETSSQYRLYFVIPAGTFIFSKQLVLLPNQFLEGSGQGKTILKAQSIDSSVPDQWIKATSHFGLMALSIEAPVKDALVGNFDNLNDKTKLTMTSLEDITIKNVSFTCSHHDDAFGGKGTSTHLLKIAGKNISITNSLFNNTQRYASHPYPVHTDNVAIMVYPIGGSIIRNNKFELGDWGLAAFIIGYQYALVERNKVIGLTTSPGPSSGISIGVSRILKHSRNILIIDNQIENITGNDREAITTDYASGSYLGMVTNSDNKTVTLQNQPRWTYQDQPFIPDNYIATIIAGRGMGQYRYIQSIQGNTFTVSEPWDVIPDKTSAISITLSHTNVQFIHNYINNSGRLQFYGNVFNGEISDNNIHSSLGIMLHSAIYLCTCVPLENISVASNTFSGNVAVSAKDKMGILVQSRFNGAISGVVINKNQTITDSTDINFMMNVNRIKPALLYGNTKQAFNTGDKSPKIKIRDNVNFQVKSFKQEDQGIAVYQ